MYVGKQREQQFYILVYCRILIMKTEIPTALRAEHRRCRQQHFNLLSIAYHHDDTILQNRAAKRPEADTSTNTSYARFGCAAGAAVSVGFFFRLFSHFFYQMQCCSLIKLKSCLLLISRSFSLGLISSCRRFAVIVAFKPKCTLYSFWSGCCLVALLLQHIFRLLAFFVYVWF